MVVRLSLLVFTVCIFLSAVGSAQTENIELKKRPLIIGETIEFRSIVLDENRFINVYLPHAYSADSAKSYPVIYLLDGSIDEDFIHISGLVQFGSFSWINLIEETIVVGIANVDRRRDFTFPTSDKTLKSDFPTSGGSAKFIRFLVEELQPLMNREYKTNGKQTLIGQSLGGLLASEILYTRPNLFANYIIVSPSLWWDNESLLKRNLPALPENMTVYIAGGKEGAIMERVASELFEKLKSSDPDAMKIHYEYFEKFEHGDILHQAVYNAFETIFKETPK